MKSTKLEVDEVLMAPHTIAIYSKATRLTKKTKDVQLPHSSSLAPTKTSHSWLVQLKIASPNWLGVFPEAIILEVF